MQEFKALAPTFARYLLLTIGARLSAGGWLPPEVAAEMSSDPALVEFLSGVFIEVVAVLWFAMSRARKAIAGTS